jgi:hypothetical protein
MAAPVKTLGNKSVFLLNGTDISDFLDQMDFDRMYSVLKATTMIGTSDNNAAYPDAEQYQSGLEDATFSLAGFYDGTANTGIMALLNTAITNQRATPPTLNTWAFSPVGTGAGAMYFLQNTAGGCIIKNVKIGSKDDGFITISADLQISLGVAVTTH